VSVAPDVSSRLPSAPGAAAWIGSTGAAVYEGSRRMNYSDCRSLPAMFLEMARQRSYRPFLWAKREGQFRPWTWSQASDGVLRLAAGLIALGIKPGDRVVLASENRPEWVIADLAIMSAGAITVPAYTTNTIDDHRHILRNSGARLAIASTTALTQRVAAAAAGLAELTDVIMIDPEATPPSGTVKISGWNDALSPDADARVDARTTELTPDDVACIIHTSGTGGAPKGVMLSHRNILVNCRGAYSLLQPLGIQDEKFLSFLPLSHAYEHSAGLMFPISIGAEIYFAAGAETLARDLLDVRPTMMTAVPRLYETMHQRISLGIAREGRWKRFLFEQAVALGRKRIRGTRMSVAERLVDLMLEKLVRDKVRARFGGQLKVMISGGAPLNPEIGSYFAGLGAPLLQGYGQTEAGPIICCNPPGKAALDTVGPPLDGVIIRIAGDGEILVSGDNVMKGYWNDPTETARTVIDGWLHTGDVGGVDRDGYLRITDRKRDFIKNSGGELISPARVEGALTLVPEIAQAVVFGDQRPYSVAVLVPDDDFLKAYAKKRGTSAELSALSQEADFHKMLREVVERVNRNLAAAERVRRFIIAAEPFAVANAQLTPTLKVRRHVVRAAYRDALEMLYEGKGV
jgi:long-chain acyl-CoA synthetase